MNTVRVNIQIILASQTLTLLETSALSEASFSVSSQSLTFIIW